MSASYVEGGVPNTYVHCPALEGNVDLTFEIAEQQDPLDSCGITSTM